MKAYLLPLFCYVMFVWQSALRPDMVWSGYSPAFLALALVSVLWALKDAHALIAAAILGLLSDSLTEAGLGNDMLCYLGVGVFVQSVCAPRLVRHPGWLLATIGLATSLVELSTTLLRSTFSRTSTKTLDLINLDWLQTVAGDAIYTMLIAIPLIMICGLWNRSSESSKEYAEGNHWHRLTG